MQRIIAMAALLCLTGVARADWVELGAATYCSPDGNGFALLPMAVTNDEATTIAAPDGHRVLPLGEDQVIVCKVGPSRVVLQISRYGPQESGAGQGSGVMMISSLTIDGSAVLKDVAHFNWKVLDERVLTSISVRPAGDQVALALCRSNGFDWRGAYAEQQCEIRLVGKRAPRRTTGASPSHSRR